MIVMLCVGDGGDGDGDGGDGGDGGASVLIQTSDNFGKRTETTISLLEDSFLSNTDWCNDDVIFTSCTACFDEPSMAKLRGIVRMWGIAMMRLY